MSDAIPLKWELVLFRVNNYPARAFWRFEIRCNGEKVYEQDHQRFEDASEHGREWLLDAMDEGSVLR